MRILLVNYEFPPLGGGGGAFSKALGVALARRGHEVFVVTSGALGIHATEEEASLSVKRVFCLKTRNKVSSLPSLCLFPIASLVPIYRLAKNVDAQLINAHFAIPSGLGAVAASKVARIPLVTTVMGADVYDPTRYCAQRTILNKIVSLVLDQSILVICPSVDMMERTAKLTKTPIRVIPHCVSSLSFRCEERISVKRRYHIDDNCKIILTVCRLIKRKSLDVALRAMAKVLKRIPDVKYIIVGEGPEKDRLISLARELKIEKSVIFAGYVPDRELPSYYSQADVFVLSSSHEAFGLVLLESMWFGTPVVASDCGGPRDLVREGKNGYLFHVGDADMLAEKLEFILDHEDLRQEQGEYAKAFVARYYTCETISRQYEKIFGEALSSKKELA